MLAARSNGLSEAAGRDAAMAAARSYRERLREVAEMSPLEAWYTRIGPEELSGLTDDPQIRKRLQRRIEAAMGSGFAGHGSGVESKRTRVPAYITGILVATMVLLIQDIDRPGSGFIRVSQQPIANAAAAIDAFPGWP